MTVQSRPVEKASLEYGRGLKRIGVYRTRMKWQYHNSPRDWRLYDALCEWNPALAKLVDEEYECSHLGIQGLSDNLSLYNRVYDRESKFAPEVVDMLDVAEDHVFTLLNTGERVGFRAVDRYRPSGNTNSGLPHLKGRKEILERIHEEADELNTLIRSTPERSFKSYLVPPTVPFMKPSVSTGPSSRGIWCLPAVITCLEDTIGTPLYRLLLAGALDAGLPLMHGPSAFSRARGFIRSIDVGESLVTKDYVKGDTNIPPWLIKRAKRVLERFVDFSTFEYERKDDEEVEKGQKRTWDYIWWYFINTPIVFNDVLYRKTGGIPSGSLFTLLCWCVVSLIVNTFLSLRVEGRLLRREDIMVCGDDSVVRVLTSGLSFDDFNNAAKEIGVLFHGLPKSGFATYPHHLELPTLSTYFDQPEVLRRDEVKMFAKMVYPARWIANREESIARAMMVSMSVFNTMHNIHEFVFWYATFKPAWLGKPIFVDRNLQKYFMYVLGRGGFRGAAKLGDVYRPFRRTVKNVIQSCLV